MTCCAALPPSDTRRANVHAVLHGRPGRIPRLHGADPLAESIDFIPVGEFNNRCRVGWAAGHSHDEADHETVDKAVARIIQLAGKDGQLLWLPGDFSQKLAQVGVGLRLVLFRFSGNDIDREKSVELNR